MTDDSVLLWRYAHERSEGSFAELVRRHVDLVYSAGLRQTGGDHHRAQEVTQMVFIDLARKASRLIRHPVLPAWLHRSSHLAARDLRRREGRRLRYERAAGVEASITGPHVREGEPASWEAVRPVLDEAINELDERDRQAVLLRYFSNRPFAEVGLRLNLSENAARMRVERALDKLHGRLAKRGITSSTTALAAALTAQAVVAAPAGVALASTSAAIAAGGAGVWIALMNTPKLPLALTAALLAGGAATIAVEANSGRKLAAELAYLARMDQAVPELRAQNAGLAAVASRASDLESGVATVSALRAQVAALEAKASARARPVRTAALDAGKPVLDFSRLDVLPKLATQTRPVYPAEVSSAGGSGQVMVDFVVGSDGLVYNAYAVSSTNRDLEDAAVQAVNGWTFQPGQVAGQNVLTHMQVPIVFTLSDSRPAPPTPESWF